MEAFRLGNLALRFLLELAALTAFGVWGWQTSERTMVKVVFAIGTPVLGAMIWGLFVAPRRRIRGRPVVRWTIEAVFFVLAAAALWTSGYPLLGAVLLTIYGLNRLMLRLAGRSTDA